MRQTNGFSLKKACLWACRCFGLLAALASLRGTWADEWITPPSTPRYDAAQIDFQVDPLSARLSELTSPDSPDDRDTWTADHAPRPSEFFRDESGRGQNKRDVTPPVLPRDDPVLPLGYEDVAIRAGWWGVTWQGSPTKVGEYQDLDSSPFWDIDFLKSDRNSTLDLYGTGLDNESTQAGLYLFTPAYEADLRYQRFLHRLDHDPLVNLPRPGSGAEIIAEDLNVGEDYAVRVQDFQTDFSGKLSENVKYHLDVWIRRKKGERQALGTHHGAPRDGFPCRVCHVVSQPQEIDWLSTRVEPAIEARIGPITAEYSRPMRFFGQNDAVVTRSYGSFHPYENIGVYPYAVVPETVWQSDRLKLRTELPQQTSVYSQIFHGTTHNLHRDTNRGSYGFDVRLSNSYFSRMTLSGFVRYNRQLNQLPPFLVAPEDITLFVPTAIVPPYDLRHPIDYLRTSTGADAVWRPFRTGGLADQLAVNAGAELGAIDRSYATYQVENPPGFVSQDHTSYVSYALGTSMRWHPRFDNRLRYKHRNTSDPVYGLNSYFNVTNTNRPTSEDVVCLDTTWLAADNLMATASVSLENRHNHSSIADFVEDDYPMTFTFWYAPRPAWSLSGGYGFYSNWIDQDIYFPGDVPDVEPLDRREWNYGGRGQLLSFAGSYAWTKQLTFSGSLQWVWAADAFDPLEPWPDLPSYSNVLVNTQRYVSGIDWYAHTHISAYLRYVYENYDDASASYNSGRAHMVLAGLTGTR
ncbi:MAG: hypothetical protein ACYC4U_08145 [Pirellulaceae bacterium]